MKILREADKTPVAEVAKKHGVAGQTIYLWRLRLGKLEPVDVKRLRQLEVENRRLKRVVTSCMTSKSRSCGRPPKTTGRHVGSAPPSRVCTGTRLVPFGTHIR